MGLESSTFWTRAVILLSYVYDTSCLLLALFPCLGSNDTWYFSLTHHCHIVEQESLSVCVSTSKMGRNWFIVTSMFQCRCKTLSIQSTVELSRGWNLSGAVKGYGVSSRAMAPTVHELFPILQWSSTVTSKLPGLSCLSVCLIYAFVLSVTELYLNLKWLIGRRILHVQMHLYLLWVLGRLH